MCHISLAYHCGVLILKKWQHLKHIIETSTDFFYPVCVLVLAIIKDALYVHLCSFWPYALDIHTCLCFVLKVWAAVLGFHAFSALFQFPKCRQWPQLVNSLPLKYALDKLGSSMGTSSCCLRAPLIWPVWYPECWQWRVFLPASHQRWL